METGNIAAISMSKAQREQRQEDSSGIGGGGLFKVS